MYDAPTDDLSAEVLVASQRIFSDLADLQTVNAARDESWRDPLWSALDEAGLTRAWLPEEAGGAGLGLAAGFAVLRAAGQWACPVPLAETLLAGLALSRAGLAMPEGVLTVPVRGGLAAVPCGATATHLVTVEDGATRLYACDGLTARPRATDMGDERADLDLGDAQPVAEAPGLTAEAFTRLGAAARACQMAGALETALQLSLDYAGGREAFGRPIAKFQAVQHLLARLGGEVAAALAASGSAADTLDKGAGEDDLFLEVAAAKIRCGEAANTGAAIAHQVHGAIGWTQDHVLQRLTRRLYAWRDDFGAEAVWAIRLGNHVSARGADALWPALTCR